MVLGNESILFEQEQHGLITPFTFDAVQPASVDLRISDCLKFFGGNFVVIEEGCGKAVRSYNTSADKEGFLYLPPNGFALASTVEKIRLPLHLAATVEGRSSVGRLGLSVHITAGWIDPGFHGNITLELKNETNKDMYIKANIFICQIVFHKVSGCTIGYHGKYNGQDGPTESRL
jgi:dCTP deaminase